MMTIPVNEPLMSGNELKYVSECIKTNWISSAGPYIERFESEWAGYCGQKYGVTVSNGSVALEIAVEVCGFSEGSEIILPSFTIVSCVNAIIKSRCVPVLVDCDPETYCMDVNQIERKITKRTVAIMPVHIYGNPCYMDSVMDIARKHNLIVIEDAAEVHGAEYKSAKDNAWHRCGSFGHLACFSFYANKLITAGEGGMVLTSDDKLNERLRKHRNLCFLKSPRFLHYHIGNNFRMTNVQAALGLAQFENLDKTIKRKREMANKYFDLLKDLPLQLPTEPKWARGVTWMYGVVLREEKDQQDLTIEEYEEWPNYKIMKKLSELKVQTRPFFIGMHEQPVFNRLGYFKDQSYPVTEKIARTGFYIPSGQAITDAQIEEVAAKLKRLLK